MSSVTLTNPAGNAFVPYDTLTVSFVRDPVGMTTDWIALYVAGKPYPTSPDYLLWQYLNGSPTTPPGAPIASGSVVFDLRGRLDILPGSYEFRLLEGGGTNLALARTPNLTVVASTINGSPSEVVPGGIVTWSYTGDPGMTAPLLTDWLAIHPSAGGAYVDWCYLNGTQTAPLSVPRDGSFNHAMPGTLGTYIGKFMTGGSTVVAQTGLMTVTASPNMGLRNSFMQAEDFMRYNVWRPVTVDVEIPVTDGIFVGSAGDVSAVMENNQAVTLRGLPAGAWLPIATRRINASGTSATNLVALYIK